MFVFLDADSDLFSTDEWQPTLREQPCQAALIIEIASQIRQVDVHENENAWRAEW